MAGIEAPCHCEVVSAGDTVGGQASQVGTALLRFVKPRGLVARGRASHGTVRIGARNGTMMGLSPSPESAAAAWKCRPPGSPQNSKVVGRVDSARGPSVTATRCQAAKRL